MTKRKVERGQPLDEVKGSLDYQMAQIRRAFYRQFNADHDWYPYIVEIFAEHVIVEADDLAQDEFYLAGRELCLLIDSDHSLLLYFHKSLLWKWLGL